MSHPGPRRASKRRLGKNNPQVTLNVPDSAHGVGHAVGTGLGHAARATRDFAKGVWAGARTKNPAQRLTVQVRYSGQAWRNTTVAVHSAAEAEHVARGWKASDPGLEVRVVPVAQAYPALRNPAPKGKAQIMMFGGAEDMPLWTAPARAPAAPVEVPRSKGHVRFLTFFGRPVEFFHDERGNLWRADVDKGLNIDGYRLGKDFQCAQRDDNHHAWFSQKLGYNDPPSGYDYTDGDRAKFSLPSRNPGLLPVVGAAGLLAAAVVAGRSAHPKVKRRNPFAQQPGWTGRYKWMPGSPMQDAALGDGIAAPGGGIATIVSINQKGTHVWAWRDDRGGFGELYSFRLSDGKCQDSSGLVRASDHFAAGPRANPSSGDKQRRLGVRHTDGDAIAPLGDVYEMHVHTARKIRQERSAGRMDATHSKHWSVVALGQASRARPKLPNPGHVWRLTLDAGIDEDWPGATAAQAIALCQRAWHKDTRGGYVPEVLSVRNVTRNPRGRSRC